MPIRRVSHSSIRLRHGPHRLYKISSASISASHSGCRAISSLPSRSQTSSTRVSNHNSYTQSSSSQHSPLPVSTPSCQLDHRIVPSSLRSLHHSSSQTQKQKQKQSPSSSKSSSSSSPSSLSSFIKKFIPNPFTPVSPLQRFQQNAQRFMDHVLLKTNPYKNGQEPFRVIEVSQLLQVRTGNGNKRALQNISLPLSSRLLTLHLSKSLPLYNSLLQSFRTLSSLSQSTSVSPSIKSQASQLISSHLPELRKVIGIWMIQMSFKGPWTKKKAERLLQVYENLDGVFRINNGGDVESNEIWREENIMSVVRALCGIGRINTVGNFLDAVEEEESQSFSRSQSVQPTTQPWMVSISERAMELAADVVERNRTLEGDLEKLWDRLVVFGRRDSGEKDNGSSSSITFPTATMWSSRFRGCQDSGKLVTLVDQLIKQQQGGGSLDVRLGGGILEVLIDKLRIFGKEGEKKVERLGEFLLKIYERKDGKTIEKGEFIVENDDDGLESRIYQLLENWYFNSPPTLDGVPNKDLHALWTAAALCKVYAIASSTTPRTTTTVTASPSPSASSSSSNSPSPSSTTPTTPMLELAKALNRERPYGLDDQVLDKLISRLKPSSIPSSSSTIDSTSGDAYRPLPSLDDLASLAKESTTQVTYQIYISILTQPPVSPSDFEKALRVYSRAISENGGGPGTKSINRQDNANLGDGEGMRKMIVRLLRTLRDGLASEREAHPALALISDGSSVTTPSTHNDSQTSSTTLSTQRKSVNLHLGNPRDLVNKLHSDMLTLLDKDKSPLPAFYCSLLWDIYESGGFRKLAGGYESDLASHQLFRDMQTRKIELIGEDENFGVGGGGEGRSEAVERLILQLMYSLGKTSVSMAFAAYRFVRVMAMLETSIGAGGSGGENINTDEKTLLNRRTYETVIKAMMNLPKPRDLDPAFGGDERESINSQKEEAASLVPIRFFDGIMNDMRDSSCPPTQETFVLLLNYYGTSLATIPMGESISSAATDSPTSQSTHPNFKIIKEAIYSIHDTIAQEKDCEATTKTLNLVMKLFIRANEPGKAFQVWGELSEGTEMGLDERFRTNGGLKPDEETVRMIFELCGELEMPRRAKNILEGLLVEQPNIIVGGKQVRRAYVEALCKCGGDDGREEVLETIFGGELVPAGDGEEGETGAINERRELVLMALDYANGPNKLGGEGFPEELRRRMNELEGR